jgi:hypothetical protein
MNNMTPQEKKDIFITSIISLSIMLFVFIPYFLDPYYTSNDDIADTFGYIVKINDKSFFPDDPYAEIYTKGFVHSKTFLWLIALINKIIPLMFIINIIIPAIQALLVSIPTYQLGKKTFYSRKAGYIFSVLSSLFFWTNEYANQSVGHSIGFSLIIAFFCYYAIGKEKEDHLITIMLLSAIIYPPILAIEFPLYLYLRIKIMKISKKEDQKKWSLYASIGG